MQYRKLKIVFGIENALTGCKICREFRKLKNRGPWIGVNYSVNIKS